MEIERLKRANKVKNEIDLHKEAVRILENGGEIFVDEKIGLLGQWKSAILVEDWERRLVVHNKKQRIQALEKELEAI